MSDKQLFDAIERIAALESAIDKLCDALRELPCAPVGHECGNDKHHAGPCPLHQFADEALEAIQ